MRCCTALAAVIGTENSPCFNLCCALQPQQAAVVEKNLQCSMERRRANCARAAQLGALDAVFRRLALSDMLRYAAGKRRPTSARDACFQRTSRHRRRPRHGGHPAVMSSRRLIVRGAQPPRGGRRHPRPARRVRLAVTGREPREPKSRGSHSQAHARTACRQAGGGRHRAAARVCGRCPPALPSRASRGSAVREELPPLPFELLARGHVQIEDVIPGVELILR